MVVEAIGVGGAREMWGPLMQLEATNARHLQWLAVLACWSVPSSASVTCISLPLPVLLIFPLPPPPCSPCHCQCCWMLQLD